MGRSSEGACNRARFGLVFFGERREGTAPHCPQSCPCACRLVKQYSNQSVFLGRRHTERITPEAPDRVVFTRIAGPIGGAYRQRDRGPGRRSAPSVQLCRRNARHREQLFRGARVRELPDRRIPESHRSDAERDASAGQGESNKVNLSGRSARSARAVKEPVADEAD